MPILRPRVRLHRAPQHARGNARVVHVWLPNHDLEREIGPLEGRSVPDVRKRQAALLTDRLCAFAHGEDVATERDQGY
jgi:hypothetical protein